MYSSRQAGNNTYCLLSSPLMYFISDKCLIATKLRKYFEKTKDKVLTIRNIRRHFGYYGFSDNLPPNFLEKTSLSKRCTRFCDVVLCARLMGRAMMPMAIDTTYLMIMKIIIVRKLLQNINNY